MDKEKFKEKKAIVKDVLSTSSFEYSSNIEDKLVNQKGTVNLSFGMRCFLWMIVSALLILFLNVIGLNMRIRNCAKGIAVGIQNNFIKYEEEMKDILNKEYELFKDPELYKTLKNDPRKVITILLNAKNEDGYVYYMTTSGEVYGVDKKTYSKVSKDLAIYSELNKLLNKEGNLVESDEWFYEKSTKSYTKLMGYKIHKEDGTLDGIIAYTNAISSPFTLITDIYSEVKEMKFYIYDNNKTLIYTNNDDIGTIETITKGVLNKNAKGKIVWNNDGKANTELDETDSDSSNKNQSIGSFIAHIARNVGNNLKKDSLSDTVFTDHATTGYFVVLDYKRIIADVLRNLLFFYIAGVIIILTILYVMTYFYKYSKKHAQSMLKVVMYGIGSLIFVSIVFQFVSYMISSRNLSKVQGLIAGDAFFTNVSSEDYIEYAALIEHIDLDTELAEKKAVALKELSNYYKCSGLEQCEAQIITSPSYISEGIKQIINKDGVFVRFKKSGGERYLDFESVMKSHIRAQSVWIKLSGRIETNAFATILNIINQFGEFDDFEIVVGDKTFIFDEHTHYYSQVEENSKLKHDNKIETIKKIIQTKIVLHFDGYSYIVSFKNYDILFIVLIVAIGLILFGLMYFDVTNVMKNTVDEDEQDTKYKHLLAEWLSGGITIIDENDKNKEAEYDEILLERLRKSNIERLKRVKKEENNDTSDEDEDETYSRIKKEKDIFGISLFTHKRTRITNNLAVKAETNDENPQGTITELTETIVSTIQNNEEQNNEVFDAEKLKVAEERLAIKKVLDEIEEQKNSKSDDNINQIEFEEERSFDEELELSSKDERLDEKLEKKK